MSITGKDLIEKVCQKLREENVLLYDSNIRQKIESLTSMQLNDLVNSVEQAHLKAESAMSNLHKIDIEVRELSKT